MTDPAAAFDRAFADLAPGCAMRAATPDDRAFLIALSAACSPFAGGLPDALVTQQAVLKLDAHDRAYPRAMRRLILAGGAPVGMIVIDWGDAETRCVDVAVLPQHQRAGIGQRALGAWLATCDRTGTPAVLEVVRDTPAARLYARLGFVAAADDDPWSPTVTMRRATRPCG